VLDVWHSQSAAEFEQRRWYTELPCIIAVREAGTLEPPRRAAESGDDPTLVKLADMAGKGMLLDL